MATANDQIDYGMGGDIDPLTGKPRAGAGMTGGPGGIVPIPVGGNVNTGGTTPPNGGPIAAGFDPGTAGGRAVADPTAQTTADPGPPSSSASVGHDGAYNGVNREQYRDAWQSSGVTDMAGLRAWVAQHGGQVLSDNGTVMTPYGETIDMLANARTGHGTAAWGGTDGGGNSSGLPGGNNPMGGNVPGGVPTGGGGSGGGGGGGGYDAMRQQLIDQLMKRAQQGLDVSADDPTIRAQADPYAAAQDREARNYIADAAERGGPGANIEGQRRVAGEHAAQASGQFTASLIGHEIDSRRQEIQSALTGMQGYITDQDKMALEKELGYLNDATQRLGIQTNAETSRYATDVGASTSRYNNDSNNSTTRRGQDMNNDQFYSNLGLNSAHESSYWDAVRRGLING